MISKTFHTKDRKGRKEITLQSQPSPSLRGAQRRGNLLPQLTRLEIAALRSQ